MMRNELLHYGVKGMKWGVRRYRRDNGSVSTDKRKRISRDERKAAKREVRSLSKKLKRSGQAGSLVSMAAISKFSSKDYNQLSKALDNGRLLVNAKIKKNYANRSVDIYVGGQKTPTIRATMEKGKTFSAKFVDKADQIRYDEFVRYYNSRRS